MENTTVDEEFLFSNFESATDTADEQEDSIVTSLKRKKKCNQADMTEEEPTKKYISDLEQQNAKLKSIIKRMLGPQMFSQYGDAASTNTRNGDCDGEIDGEIDLIQRLDNEIQSKPFAIVLYMNNDVSSVHRKDIEETMKAVSAKKATQEVLLAQKLQAQNSAVPIKAFTANFKGRRCNPSNLKDGEEPFIVCACQYFKSFFIDRMGAPLLESDPGRVNLWDVPQYQQVFLKALPILEEALNVRVKQVRQCFNCGGEHHLNECTQPKDMKRINLSRQQYSASRFNSPGGYDAKRHALEEEIEERFKHFKPGQISVGLEEALSISLKTQVPAYIYKMRKTGYPPGWVKPSDDGLKIYGAEGNVIEEPGYEEGEIKPIQLPDIILYPGFNCPLPEGVPDEHEMYGMPPYQSHLADLDIARQRAQYLGYTETEPVAKRLKYDGTDDMEIDNQTNNFESGKPPLPLIEVTEEIVRPPSPEIPTLSSGEVTKTEDGDKDVPSSFPPKTNVSEELCSENKESTRNTESVKKPLRLPVAKQIDETTYRNWYIHEPLSSVGITYVMYTPPPTCRGEVLLEALPKDPLTDLDREPWKTASASWYDPLYGDLSTPTGTYDAIRTLFKETKRAKRKPML